MLSARSVLPLAGFLCVVLAAACSSDPEADAETDAPSACTDLCAKAGFGSGRSDVQPNEINCFCTSGGGQAQVTNEACLGMCKGLGKSKGEGFKSNATAPGFDACQCD